MTDLYAYTKKVLTSIHPQKSRGQHFLINPAIAEKITQALQLDFNDTVFEIGCGIGGLTFSLVNFCKKVIAIDIDTQLLQILKKNISKQENLLLINADILKFNFYKLCQRIQPLKVVGNLPYAIASKILHILLDESKDIFLYVLMVQYEVAKRIIASVNTKDYCPLTLFVSYHCHAELIKKISPKNFLPQPKVWSAIVSLRRRLPPAVADKELLFCIIRAAFAKRRKMLHNSLKSLYLLKNLNICSLLDEAGIWRGARAENLTLSDFIRLTNVIANKINGA